MPYHQRYQELIKKGVPKSKALSQALEEQRLLKEEAKKKAEKIEKKRKAKEDKERKKQRGTKPLSSLADDAALAD